MGRIRKYIAGGILACSLVLFFIPPSENLSREVLQGGALVVFTMGFWATGVLPEYLTALAFLLMATLFRVAPEPVVFSGFYSGALWLVFGGLIIAGAVQKTGFDRRISAWLLTPSIRSYFGIIASIVLMAMLLGFFIPATMGRVILLVPLATAMAEHLGFSEESPGRKGMVLAATLSSFVPSCAVLPANAPNMVLAGASETLYGLTFSYGTYLKMHYPVTGILKGIAIVVLTCILFPDRLSSAPSTRKTVVEPFNGAERLLTLILSITLILWGTDFLHGVSPAWVALAAALVCMLPFTGVFPNGSLGRDINFGPFFYVAGVLGIVGVIGETGLAEILGEKLLPLIGFKPGHDLRNFFSLALLSSAINPLATAPGVVAIMAPLSAKISSATGFPLATVLMTHVIGFSNVILPYHIPPVVVGLQMGRVGMREGARLTLALAAVSIFILMPINYLWWCFLGVF